ncbi:hypothetical protein Patl1_17124 [Pistacia atlantica]|uniref:Uncharacterized protein n=1 Tax=Pistacia atlantica TaxID=434234 RepID=A0ACC1B7N4_9ROSI|nr:hypothetical protein Patl1_17124 [Pistacia atlantica]
MALKRVRVWLMLISMFISLQGWRMEGCLKQERSALLQLKHFFNNPNRLQNWVEGYENSDCCYWESVYCDFATGRVSGLDLGSARNQELGEWYLNVSLFSPFQEIQRLNLSYNLIAGCVENEGFERLSHLNNFVALDLSDNMFNDSRILPGLSNLEHLSLRGNMFNNSILSYVSTLSLLKQLDLTDIGLKDTVDLQELDSLRHLQRLSMGGNEIKRIVISKELPLLKNLTGLRISDTVFHNNFFQMIGTMTSLEYLYITSSDISGTLLDQELPWFKNLIDLQIHHTVFQDNFLQIFAAMTSLQFIVIGSSDLNDTLLDQVLPTFKSLKYVEFHDIALNNFPAIFNGSCNSLETLLLDNCNLTNTLPGQELPTFKSLTKLDISNTIFNNNNSLQMLSSMTSLEYLSIVNCTFKSTSLDEGICKMHHLMELRIIGNGLTWWCVANLTSLFELDISINSFSGHIPMEFGAYLSVLNSFNISGNAFEGMIPSSFGDMKSLTYLDMSNNLLTGGIPEELAGCISLGHLALSNNSLQGQIF